MLISLQQQQQQNCVVIINALKILWGNPNYGSRFCKNRYLLAIIYIKLKSIIKSYSVPSDEMINVAWT